MRPLATMKITSLTPSAMGGCDPNQHDDILRGPSLRGLAAWWLRAIVSGKAYDNGDLQYRDKAIEIQKKILGATEKSSLLLIKPQTNKISKINTSTLTYMTKRGLAINHIRLQLLLMGEKDNKRNVLEEMLRIFDATLKIYSFCRSSDFLDEEALGLYSLTLSLLLEGVGKGARRGLGAVKIESINPSQDVEEYLRKNNYNGLLEISRKMDGETLKKVIEDAVKIAGKVISKISGKNNEAGVRETAGEMPRIPSLSRSSAQIYLKNIDLTQTFEERLVNMNGLLKKLFLRSPRPSNRLVDKLQNTIPIRKSTNGKIITVSYATALGSYILGLPRAAGDPQDPHEYKVAFKTGVGGVSKTIKVKNLPKKDRHSGKGQYSGFVEFRDGKYEPYRRPSPVIVTLLDEKTAVITLFKSSDWPGKLEWFTCKQKEVTTLTVAEAYREVSKYLSNYCQRKIWP